MAYTTQNYYFIFEELDKKLQKYYLDSDEFKGLKFAKENTRGDIWISRLKRSFQLARIKEYGEVRAINPEKKEEDKLSYGLCYSQWEWEVIKIILKGTGTRVNPSRRAVWYDTMAEHHLLGRKIMDYRCSHPTT